MGISNFPVALQPILQQGFLEREFQQAMASRLGYRACADREEFSVGIGETLTKTRAGLKPSVTSPVPAAMNVNLDNGLTPTGWGVEQYTLTINHYAATTDLNMVTSRVGIASQFLQNAAINGEQAARSLDELARNALFAPYFGGNTRVRAALGSAGPVVAVDDLRGFTAAFVNGILSPVGGTTSLTVTVGSGVYTLIGATVDSTNVSTAPSRDFWVAYVQLERQRLGWGDWQCCASGKCEFDHSAERADHNVGGCGRGRVVDVDVARCGEPAADERRAGNRWRV